MHTCGTILYAKSIVSAALNLGILLIIFIAHLLTFDNDNSIDLLAFSFFFNS